MQKPVVLAGTFFALFLLAAASTRGDDRIRESDDEIRLALPQIEATIRKRGYVTGVDINNGTPARAVRWEY